MKAVREEVRFTLTIATVAGTLRARMVDGAPEGARAGRGQGKTRRKREGAVFRGRML